MYADTNQLVAHSVKLYAANLKHLKLLGVVYVFIKELEKVSVFIRVLTEFGLLPFHL